MIAKMHLLSQGNFFLSNFIVVQNQGEIMQQRKLLSRQLGQGMTEYIIIVALIAIAAIGVYQAFGGVVRGQTAAAAQTLAGGSAAGVRTTVTTAGTTAQNEGSKTKDLKSFEK
jgi:type IV pilus assembly protein PilA